MQCPAFIASEAASETALSPPPLSWQRGAAPGLEPNDPLQLAKPLSDAAPARLRAQHRVDFAPARRASGTAHAVEGRQRRRRGDRRRSGDHRRRTRVVRSRRRCVRARLGRGETARAERVGCFAGGVERRLLQAQVRRGERPGDPAEARLGRGHGAGRDRRLGGAARQVRFIAVRRPDGAGDRDRRARPCGGEHRRVQMGGGRAGTEGLSRFRRCLHAARPRAGDQRTRALPGSRQDFAQARGARPARVLRRRDRRADRRVRARGRRGDDGRRPAQLQGGLGRADQQGLSRLHGARDPAERAGHCGADRARHPRQVRRRTRSPSTASSRSICRSKR